MALPKKEEFSICKLQVHLHSHPKFFSLDFLSFDGKIGEYVKK